MWRRHVQRLGTSADLLARQLSDAASTPVVAAHIAQAVSSSAPRQARVPSNLVAAVDALAANSNSKDLKQKGMQLANKLKKMSRSKHRGGTQPNFRDPAPVGASRGVRGNPRQAERRALVALAQHDAAPMFAAQQQAEQADKPAASWSSGDEPAMKLLKATGPEAAAQAAAAKGVGYQESDAVAYAVVRLPACYAALHQIFQEVRRAAPEDWQPQSLLDFGAGPGTAAWAAQAAWPAAPPLKVLAVEPSENMAWVGNSILEFCQDQQLERGEAGEAAPGEESDAAAAAATAAAAVTSPAVRWIARLPPQRDNASGRRHDIVVAAYVLGELSSDSERRRRVSDLWERTGSYLVLVEPGTPSGSSNILAARAGVLGREPGGAHVAAPCPHDGPCPLEGQQSWCHFSQRFERPAGAGAPPPSSYQDERFSYVVLAREARGAEPPPVRLAGAIPAGTSEESSAAELAATAPGLVPKRAALGGLVGIDSDAIERRLASGYISDGDEPGTAALAEDLRRLLEESVGGGGEDGDEEDIAAMLHADLLELLEADEAAIIGSEEDEDEVEGLDAWQEDAAAERSLPPGTAALPEVGEESQEACAAAKASSRAWSRLVRPPRKRSGHVVLDVCSAMDARGRHLGGDRGALLRQIVSKGKSVRATGGTAAFRMARNARWGDRWPADWQRRLGGVVEPAGGRAAGD